MNQRNFHKLVSGEDKSAAAVFCRFFLQVPAAIYSIIIRLRNFLYSHNWFKTHYAGAPVISVGNITTGGTGKTPLVIWLCNKITENYKCAILTRGYKTTQDFDEPAILAQSCPQSRVIVNPDRVIAAAEAVGKLEAEVLIMDDGFQHRRLARDLDIVMIDSTNPFGYGRMLPAGLLREPETSLRRADVVVITRCNQITNDKLEMLETKIKSIKPDILIARSIHKPVCAKNAEDEKIEIEHLRNKKVFAFCGIGNPQSFFNTISELDMKPTGRRIYDDHYHYTNDDISAIYGLAKNSGADLILTTQKDWTKIIGNCRLSNDSRKDILLAYLAVELRFVAGEDELMQYILRIIKKATHYRT